jgi:hypothetical protein
VDGRAPEEENDIKESCRVLRKLLRDERGDAGDGDSKRLDELEGERAVTGGAERGGRCDVGEPRPTAGLDDDEAVGKREGLGIKMGARVRGSLRSDGTSGRAEEGAGLGDGRVRRDSREERAGRGTGAERCHDGKRWCLRVNLAPKNCIQLITYVGGLVGETYGSSGDNSLLEFKLLSAARSSERNERSSVLASEPGELELAANGLVNWGDES